MYQKKVLAFMDYPWQEDREIELIALIEENRKNIIHASDVIVRRYLKDLWKANEENLVPWVSDLFIEAFSLLIQ